MIKIKLTDKKGVERIKLVNTPAYQSILRNPSIVGAVKCEVVIEKVAATKVQIVTEAENMLGINKAEEHPDIYEDNEIYSQVMYDNDAALAKKMVRDKDPANDEALKILLTRMIEYKPTPYWKGKLNKIK